MRVQRAQPDNGESRDVLARLMSAHSQHMTKMTQREWLMSGCYRGRQAKLAMRHTTAIRDDRKGRPQADRKLPSF